MIPRDASRVAAGLVLLAGPVLAAGAQDSLVRPSGVATSPGVAPQPVPSGAYLRVERPPAQATLYGSSESFPMPVHEIWRPMCGSTPIGEAELAAMLAVHRETLATNPPVVVNETGSDAMNVVFTVSGSIPSGATAALAAAEAYLEGIFPDPITVTIPISFQQLQPGVLGGTGSAYGYVSYAGTRQVLQSGMDGNDTIQSWLPSGSTCPVRYRNSSSVTNETRVFFTLANYKATAGFVAGTDANMTFSSNFNWDFDPSNGVSGSAFSFVDVVIHETGHALGFTSGGDFRSRDMEVLDLFRFQRTDGSGDYNPDTLAEFQVRARLVAYNQPGDDHNSDLISAEYRMSDGSPYQMSHLREQAANIGLMDPALAPGETWYPAYFSTADVALFDAIGYDN